MPDSDQYGADEHGFDKHQAGFGDDEVVPSGNGPRFGLVGVGGWLQFLIVVLCVISPALSILMTLSEFSSAEAANSQLPELDAWSSLKTLSIVTVVASSALNFWAGYLLWKRHQKATVKAAISIIWLANPIFSFLGLLSLSQIVGDGALSSPDAGAAIVHPFFFALIWTLYLLKSKRVRNTYK